MKKCPFCAEEIQDEAIVCRFCGRELAPEKVAQVSDTLTGQEKISSELKIDYTDNGVSASKALSAFTETEERDRETPIWKKAFQLGGIFTLVYVIYLLSQYSQGRVSSERVVLDLLFGAVAWLAIGTIAGFVFVPLWRWKKWAPFTLIAVIVTGVVGYASGIVDLSIILPGSNRGLSATNTSTPIRTPTPQEVTLLGKSFNIDNPQFSTKQEGMNFQVRAPRPDEKIYITGAPSKTPIPGEIIFEASTVEFDNGGLYGSGTVDSVITRQFICEAATIMGYDCNIAIEYYEQALLNNYVSKGGVLIWVKNIGSCNNKFTEPLPDECLEKSGGKRLYFNVIKECCEDVWSEGQEVSLQFSASEID